MRRIATRVAGAAAATALAVTASLMLATPAQASLGTWWGEMKVSHDLYRTPAPTFVQGYANAGDTVLINCWTTDASGAVWDKITDEGAGSSGYVQSTYVETFAGDIRNLARHC